MNAIEVIGLHKSYGEVAAVRGVDFAVPTGQVFAFLGPNGAGKTTTVEILEGYRQRTSGSVTVLGHDPADGDRALRERIGIVLQECGFPRSATVRELVRLHAGYYSRSRDADEVLGVVGLNEKSGALVRELSGGQQRRLDLALALVGDPELIFLDEPTTGFDPSARREAWDVIANLRDLGKTIFLTTHYMDEAQALADRVAVIAAGRIVAEGTPDDLGGRAQMATEIRFSLDAALQGEALPDLAGAEVVTGASILVRTTEPTPALHALTSWAMARGGTLDGLTVARPTLEDTYLRLTASATGAAPTTEEEPSR